MSWISDAAFRVRAFVRRGAMERDLSDEVAFHLEMDARKLVEHGWSPAAAAAEARRRFGVVGREEQRARDSWGIGLAVEVLSDVRIALRQLWRRPLFSVLGIGTLALGVGATVALSSVVSGLLLKPLPVRDDSRLHVFWSDYDWRGVEFDFVKERQRAFAGLAAYSTEGYTLRVNDQSSTILAGVASAELFDVLGAGPLMGRTFQAGDDRPGAAPIVVLSHGFWQQELGGDPHVIGRRLEIDGSPVEVVGVMPRGFYFPTPQLRVWRPLTLDPSTDAYQGNGWLVLVGRERAGISRGELDADVEAIAAALGARFQYPAAWDKSRGATLRSLRDYTMGAVRPAVLLLQGAVLLVLAIACANVAALVLARTTDCSAELTLRAALGAGRGRLVRQIVTESVTMSLLASGLGAGLAVVSFQALVSRLPLADGLEDTLAVDWTMFAAALALSLVVGVLVALAPVRALIGGVSLGVSRERTSGGLASGPRRVHGALVAVEVALAVLLVAGSTMLVRSVSGLYAIDAGFEAPDVTTLDLVTPTRVMAAAERREFFRQMTDRVAALPGIGAAGLVTRLPLRDGGWQGTVTIEDRPDLADGRQPNTYYRVVTAGYFPAMGIQMRAGRGFLDTDGQGAGAVGIVSEAFAQRMWPGRDPIGRRIRSAFEDEPRWITVVGVAEEARVVRMTGENPMVLYVPFAQSTAPEGAVLVVKGAGAPPSVPALRALVRELDARVAIGRVGTLDGVIAASLAEPLRLRFFLSVLGMLALVIGAVGVYSVVSYSVTRRRAEFGVRLALGAAPRRILSEVIRGGLIPVVLGVVAGLAGAMALGRILGRFLYGITPTDPLSLAAAASALLMAGAVAAFVPGLRAGRTDPVEALRAE